MDIKWKRLVTIVARSAVGQGKCSLPVVVPEIHCGLVMGVQSCNLFVTVVAAAEAPEKMERDTMREATDGACNWAWLHD